MDERNEDADKYVGKAVIYLAEAECLVDRAFANCEPGCNRHKKEVADIDYLKLQHVLMKTVAKLVGKYRSNLVGGHGVYQVVKENDSLG